MRTIRPVARSIIVAIMTAFAALILGITQTLTTAITASLGLTAVQAIIVPGTGTQHPADVLNYLPNAVNNYLVPGGDCKTGCVLNPTSGIEYDAQFWPIPLPGWGGLQGAKWNDSVHSGVVALTGAYTAAQGTGQPIVIFGYSQGATVAGQFKALHAADPQSVKDTTNYFFIGNPQRPNGGVFERLAMLGTVPVLDATFGNPTPTDTCLHSNGSTCATDVALQYDGVVDSPQWIANPLAVGNALAGFQYVHGTYLAPDGTDAPTDHPYGYTVQEVQDDIAKASAPGGCTPENYCQTHGDTIYITLPARTLPLYQPLLDLGAATGTSFLIIPFVDLVQPATQTLIETGYNRTDYGNPQPFTLLPPATFNPIQTAGQLIQDVPIGINNALTPGLQPLPGSDPNSNVVETNAVQTPVVQTNVVQTNQTATTASVPDNKPLLRLSMIAKPNEGITTAGSGGSDASHPLQNALKDVHPVKDVVNAVSGAVNKALGKDDSAGSSGSGN
jgi:pimeloyl-ACP methyl ester carboxylesterase